MRHKQQPPSIYIASKPVAPPYSWWVDAPVHDFTHYVEQTHLARMRGHKFALMMTNYTSDEEYHRAVDEEQRGRHKRQGEKGAYQVSEAIRLAQGFRMLVEGGA